ncbi:hypothetical protein RIF29_18798 [Crotalaria pallida]|uniref:Uncharacterized protein n=1 Tax=Crotalaria pallida TaxID=3830 RepID=A0AAN9IAT1_CROPI
MARKYSMLRIIGLRGYTRFAVASTALMRNSGLTIKLDVNPFHTGRIYLYTYKTASLSTVKTSFQLKNKNPIRVSSVKIIQGLANSLLQQHPPEHRLRHVHVVVEQVRDDMLSNSDQNGVKLQSSTWTFDVVEFYVGWAVSDWGKVRGERSV